MSLQEYGALHVLPAGIDLCSNSDDAAALIEAISHLGEFELIVIDTLSRAMAGGNENSPDDMGAFIKNCDTIREETGAHVLIVHHSGKNQEMGARGHSALKAAVDTEIEIKNKDEVITAKVTKQRDGKTNQEFHFALKVMDLGEDEDGDKITSCALEATEVLAIKGETLTGQARKAYTVLTDLMCYKSFQHTPKPHMKPQKCVRLNDFKEDFIKAGISETDKPDSVAKAFLRAKNKLKSLGYIGEWDNYIWLLDRPDNEDRQ